MDNQKINDENELLKKEVDTLKTKITVKNYTLNLAKIRILELTKRLQKRDEAIRILSHGTSNEEQINIVLKEEAA